MDSVLIAWDPPSARNQGNCYHKMCELKPTSDRRISAKVRQRFTLFYNRELNSKHGDRALQECQKFKARTVKMAWQVKTLAEQG